MTTRAVEMDAPFEEATRLVREALVVQGFGILTEADLRATFATKLGEEAADELGDYLIFGACNPPLARRALAADPSVGLLLPCNVVVRRPPGAARTTVEAVDPSEMLALSDAAALADVARDAGERLDAVIGTLRA